MRGVIGERTAVRSFPHPKLGMWGTRIGSDAEIAGTAGPSALSQDDICSWGRFDPPTLPQKSAEGWGTLGGEGWKDRRLAA
jgi:hypothetical protein